MAGVLCGNCRNGSGVSVLQNKCVTCHDALGMLITVLSEYQACIVVEWACVVTDILFLQFL